MPLAADRPTSPRRPAAARQRAAPTAAARRPAGGCGGVACSAEPLRTARRAAVRPVPAIGERAYRARSSARPSNRASSTASPRSSASRQPLGGGPRRLRRVDRHPVVDHRVDQLVPGGVRVRAYPGRRGAGDHHRRDARRGLARPGRGHRRGRGRGGLPPAAQQRAAQRRRRQQREQHDHGAEQVHRPGRAAGRRAAAAPAPLSSNRPALRVRAGGARAERRTRPGGRPRSTARCWAARRGRAPTPAGSSRGRWTAGSRRTGPSRSPAEVDLGPGVQVEVGQRSYVSPSRLLPLVKPNATRAGMPAARTIQAIAAAYCWQKPCLLSRKSTMSSPDCAALRCCSV